MTHIVVRVSTQEKAGLQELAGAVDASLSAFIRAHLSELLTQAASAAPAPTQASDVPVTVKALAPIADQLLQVAQEVGKKIRKKRSDAGKKRTVDTQKT